PAEVENIDQPVGRSDDAFCRGLRGYLSFVPYGASVESILAVPGSEYGPGNVAEFSQSADLGRVRRIDLLYGFGVVLVCRPDSGSGYATRSRSGQDSSSGVWIFEFGMARVGPALAAL